ncbi:MAG: UDP-N-acetylglucosamine 2-epimerase (non-hydrolyzing) [Pyrinomonadaceae bacterium]
MLRVLSIVGTRPEAVKMAPVIRELARRAGRVRSRVCATAQHREMLDQVLSVFRVVPDYDLDLMRGARTPAQVASATLARLEPVLERERPDWILVQGDTTTVMAAAVAAFYAGVRVGHVEAGLRTHDPRQPFPEEGNRRVAGCLADLHFAPTEGARANLLRENVSPGRVVVTGNPVVDALREMSECASAACDPAALGEIPPGARVVLVTAHRRENFGAPLEAICRALAELARRYAGDVRVVYLVHRNPRVWETAHRLLGSAPGVTLLPPVDYLTLVRLLKRCHMVLTDSGGLQEEAPCLGKPLLVLRDKTERPEALEAGCVRLVGTDAARIVVEASRLLDCRDCYSQMARPTFVYGDGHAAPRIVDALLSYA